MSEKVKKPKMKRGWKITLWVLLAIFLVIGVFVGVVAIVTTVSSQALLTSVSEWGEVEYDHERILPVLDETGAPKLDEYGNFNFVDESGLLEERNFKVLQLTDIHIGAGAFSIKKDKAAVQTVVDLITKAQPDLVVVTGDIAYPVVFQAGSFNNKTESKAFADLMESLGVYWTLCFGNHDTEVYSLYDREQIGELYANREVYKHCLFNNEKRVLDNGEQVFGVGNFAINVRDKDGDLVHTLFMMDSNAYQDSDPLGVLYHYDNIHNSQIEWYEQTASKLGLVGNEKVKSTMYFHIATTEFRYVYEHREDSEHIYHCDGRIGEHQAGALGTSLANDIYDAWVRCGTTGVFVGHDHENNASYLYDKDGFGNGNMGVKLTYGMSVDYLAYIGICKRTEQRGGRVVEINSVENVHMTSDMMDSEYNQELYDYDQKAGFATYRMPYWKNLYAKN